MAEPHHTVGFVYVLMNLFMPGLVKLGCSSWLPEDRAKGLYTTGVPAPFEIAYRAMTSRPESVERRAHKFLANHRVNERREFFSVPVEEAVEAVRLAALEIAGIESWQSSEPHILRSGDRLALSLESGQVFGLISYQNLESILTAHAEFIDLWQAHSNGDLLEIFASESASHIAGFGDDDAGGDEDPLPHLDREGTVANGMISGRERLVPGERLVWLPSPEKSASQTSVVFEAEDHCQIVSRTWSPWLGPHGFPLLLNDFGYNGVWPAAKRSMREALDLPIPRSWAARQNSGPRLDVVGSMQPLPEHWLPQLKPRPRKRR